MDHRIERERLIFFCRVEEQSAPETRASAFPRRGGGAAVPSLKARRRRSPSGRVSPHRDERDNLAAPKSSGAAVPSYEGGGGGQPTGLTVGGRWRHVWCARQNRLPLFVVLRLDARAKCARGSSTVGCCVWAFGTVGRTRSSSLTGPHRSACTARLGASGGPNSFAALLRRADE